MKEKDVEVHEGKKSFRHEVMLEKMLRSEVKDLWNIFDSKPNFRAEMDASEIDDVAWSYT